MHRPFLLLFVSTALSAARNPNCNPNAPGSGGEGEYTFMGGVRDQQGAPTGLNQATLVLYVRASDDATADLTTLRASEQAEFAEVSNYYRESSFDQLSFAYTHAPANGWYLLPRTYDDYMWTQADVVAAGTDVDAVIAAQKKQALVQDETNFFTDSLQAATDDGFNVRNFAQVVIVIVGPFHRGSSYRASNFTLQDKTADPPTSFQVSIPRIVVSTNRDWSRTAHEFGHAFGKFADLYNSVNRGLGRWDIMDCTDCTNQTTSWHKDARANWFSDTQLRVLTRPSGTARVDETIALTPYELEAPAAGAVQSVRLDVGGSTHLYIENRQTLAGQTGSRQLPANAVIITDADDNAESPNSSRKPILLFGGPITSGSSFADQTYGNLTVDVSGTNPDLTVKIGWGPAPYFDLRIAPWSPPPWESPDIWIDSMVNGFDIYEYSDPTANPDVAGSPVRNGDRPRIGRGNRVYARVTNEGTIAASNVGVSFLVSSPPGIGDAGNWTLLDRATIPTIAPGATVIAGPVIWRPSTAAHTCIKAKIDIQAGEVNANNNEAQENVGDFDTTSASPWKAFVGDVSVSNPTSDHQFVRMDVTDLPQDWIAWVSERTVSLAPGETREVRYMIEPGRSHRKEIGSRVDVSLVGHLLHEDTDIALGGVTTAVHFVRATKTEIDLSARKRVVTHEGIGSLKIRGQVIPGSADLPVALDITDSKQQSVGIVPARTETDGSARWVLGDLVAREVIGELRSGETYTFQVDFYGTESLQASSSLPVSVTVR